MAFPVGFDEDDSEGEKLVNWVILPQPERQRVYRRVAWQDDPKDPFQNTVRVPRGRGTAWQRLNSVGTLFEVMPFPSSRERCEPIGKAL